MARRGRLDEALARVEERARVRLHQAANRMEDADPLEVGAAEAVVRVLDAVDRLTGFRARHRAGRVIAEGRPGPAPRVDGSPEWGGLDPSRLDRHQRLRLRQLWRAWERARATPGEEATGEGAPAAWEAWSRAVEETRREMERAAQSASGAAESAMPSPLTETS